MTAREFMTAREVLLKASEYLTLHGWVQHKMGHLGGPCCLVGALISVDPYGEAREEAQQKIRRLLGIKANAENRHLRCLVNWNDAPGRTADEVIAALRAAAGGVQ